MALYYKAPDANYFSTTLSGAISDSATTITLSSITNLNSPGVLVIDREDGSGNATPTAREVIAYTGISGNDLTGVTRAFSSSTARSHADGALVEAVVDVTLWNDLRDGVAAALQTDGTGLHISNATITSFTDLMRVHVASIASVARAELTQAVIPSVASIAQVQSNIYAGSKGQFVWTDGGPLTTSLATHAGNDHLPFLKATKNLTINNIWAGVNSAPSLAALQINMHYRSTPSASYATVLSTVLTIDVGDYSSEEAGTAAVLALTSLASGTILSPSIDAHGGAGDLTLVLGCTERE